MAPEIRRRLRPGSALGLLAAAAVTTLALAVPSQAQAQGDTIVIARDTDFNTLDPSRSWCDSCQIYLTAVYDQLVRIGKDNETLEPRLASEWSVSDDGKTYSFTLDPKATFSDGSPVEAGDIAFSLMRLKNLKAGASFLADGIESIDTPDAKTVVVHLAAPDPEFLGKVSSPYGAIVNADLVKEHGGTAGPDADKTDQGEAWLLENSAGSGAYVLKSYRPDDELRLAANPNYWREAPAADAIVMREVQDAVSQMQMLQSGGADIAMQIDPDTAETVGSPDVVTELVPSFNFVYIALSPGAKDLEVPLGPKVREAIGLAIDYDGLLEVTTGGAADLIASPVPTGFPGTKDLPMPAQDVDKAKALLAEAGLGDGFTLVAAYPETNIYGVDLTIMMQKVQQDLAKVNIDVKLEPVTFAVWRERVGGDHIPLTAVYYAPDYYGSGQYANYFGMVPGSPWYGRAGGENAEGLANGRMAELLEEVRTAAPEDAAELYHEMALEMIADRVIIPLVNPKLVLAYRKGIDGVRYAVCCNLPLEELSKQ
ncbi:ABC transporter substrate-binding protein [Kaustia mangrovi]|uniref:ABC transporter substrate-binding protein n=1 Tax=Kaustia mangrovi TaxID=2593653 RepID=A0A7S8C383_9HYPH|nr:ABC transporter substrate-binding protein [Kaustia mangrovi]